MRWDIFCKVIDNHGDIGVCWRLSAQLARRGEQVRLWVDDASALAWMAPHGEPGVQVLGWTAEATAGAEPGDVVVEAFGCALDDAFVAAMALAANRRGKPPVWINLEYLSAEPYVERCHGLPSPGLHGPGAGLVKRFFYPGFTARTGGLLRESDLLRRQQAFDATGWLHAQGATGTATRVSLFCYEPPALPALLDVLAAGPGSTELLLTAGRAQSAVQAVIERKNRLQPAWNMPGVLSFLHVPLMPQHEFDHLLWACDLNFVRGEDSLVRALWAGKPFVWQLYPQDDGAHAAKLEAFLDWLKAPASLRQFHRAWNGLGGELPPIDLPAWGECATAARARLLAQDDLATQLMRAVMETQ